MGIPVSQMWTVATYVLRQKFAGRERYPLVLMLEPLFRCNLACAGCGKIQYPAHVLKMNLSPDECFRAVDECGAPMVSIPAESRSCIPRSTRSSRVWSRGGSTFISAPMRCCCARNSTFSSPASI